MRSKVVVSLTLAASLVAGAASASERGVPVQVLTLTSDSAYENAQALTIALKRAVDRSRRYALGKGDFSLEVLMLSLGCTEPPNAACKRKIGATVGTEGFVWGQVERDGKEVVASLHLWEASGAETDTTLRYAANLTDAADDLLLEIAERAFQELAGGASTPLIVRGPDAVTGGELVLDGEPVGKLTEGRAELLVEPGDHEVRLRRPGKPDLVGQVTVTKHSRAELRLTVPPAEQHEQAAQERAHEAESTRSTRAYWGYGALGLGAALVGGGVWSALKVNDVDSDPRFMSYRSALAKGKDVCDEAERDARLDGTATDPAYIRDQCSTLDTFGALQYVFFGLGAAALGTGAYFLLTDGAPPEEQSGLLLTPSVAADGRSGFMDLRLSF